MTNTLITVVLVALALYLAVLLSLWHFQERIVFQPPTNPESPFEGTRRLQYSSRDGVALTAHVIEPDGESRGVVLAFHGNAMIARWLIPWARELARRARVAVVLPEYRGYDGLEGSPTYESAGQDAEAALEAAAQHFGIGPDRMIYYGHSLGTAVAVELASARLPGGLALESPFTSAHDIAARWRVFGVRLLWKRISRVHYDTVHRVSTMAIPVHVAHGERDIIVPVRMGRAVHAAARSPGALLLIPGAGHNDVAPTGGEAYWQWLGNAVSASSQ